MSLDMQHPELETGKNEPSIGSLMAGIVADFEKLMGQQLALLKREVQEDVRQAVAALAMVAFGAAVVLIAAIALTFGAVYAVHHAFSPPWSLESSFTLVGACLAVVGGLMLWGGVQLFSSINPVPERSIEALQENVQCLTTHQKTSNVK
jgi:protein-S-isoprenylcysteine O-methyltransferase Ste14